MNLTAPEVLSRPIIQVQETAAITQPTGRIRPRIDGLVSSYFEWMGAGQYQIAQRGGAMHGKRFIFSLIQFGIDGEKLYLRVDFVPGAEEILKTGELRCTLRSGGEDQRALIRLSATRDTVKLEPGGAFVDWAANSILELAIPLGKGHEGGPFDLCLSIWKDGLPVDAVPQQGWLTIAAESTWAD